jgi:hypothetical protein
MPPKREYKAEDVINAALEVVREKGISKLSTRTIAEKLHSSTMPIYYSGITMPDIEKEIATRAWAILEKYQSKVRTGDPVMDMIIGFVMFAREEKNLFRCFRNEKLNAVNIVNAEKAFLNNMQILKDHDIMKRFSAERVMDVLIQGWIFANGIALLVNSPIVKTIPELNSEESIIRFIKDATRIYWRGVESILEENEEKAKRIDSLSDVKSSRT